MDGIYKLEEWIINGIERVSLEQVQTESIHIDEINGFDNSQEILNISISILENISIILKNKNTKGVSIFLAIDLVPRSIYPIKKINKMEILIKDILPKSIPEIIIYKPSNSLEIPLVELHRIPLNNLFFSLKGNFNVFYKETRTLSDIEKNIKLNREILFLYKNSN